MSEAAIEDDPAITGQLLAAVVASTPQVRDAILTAILSRRDRYGQVLDLVEKQVLPAAVLSAAQRTALLEASDAVVRERARALLTSAGLEDPQAFARYAAALQGTRDPVRGGELFRQNCGKCHRAHGVGFAVGPDLSAEFQRAEETILHDILIPSGTLTSGYVTYVIETTDGRILSGLLASESASSILLNQPEGKTESVLRKDIEDIRASSVSLMPDNLIKSLRAARRGRHRGLAASRRHPRPLRQLIHAELRREFGARPVGRQIGQMGQQPLGPPLDQRLLEQLALGGVGQLQGEGDQVGQHAQRNLAREELLELVELSDRLGSNWRKTAVSFCCSSERAAAVVAGQTSGTSRTSASRNAWSGGSSRTISIRSSPNTNRL